MIKPVIKNGFTLIELMIAMAISGMAMAAVASVFLAQVTGQISQDTSLEMTQGARAALQRMADEIRMAKCDPTQNANSGFITAGNANLNFSMDITGSTFGESDGDTNDPNEIIRYALTNDADGNGIADGTPCNLGRATGGGALQPIALNIDALNFVYLAPDNTNTPADADGDPDILASPVAAANLNNIEYIEVTLVARGGQEIRGLLRTYTDNTVYRNQQRAVILPAQNDDFRRLSFTSSVAIRN